MPHMARKSVLSRFQSRFADEVLQTSSRRFRSSTDFQFSLSYFYFLMSESEDNETLLQHLFDEIDADQDDVLRGSFRVCLGNFVISILELTLPRVPLDSCLHHLLLGGELRVLATRLMPTPLTTLDFDAFLLSIANCSRDPVSTGQNESRANSGFTEETHDSPLPRMSRAAYQSCPFWREPLQNYIKELKKTKWPFQVAILLTASLIRVLKSLALSSFLFWLSLFADRS